LQFEGTEKKFELTIGEGGPGLRSLGRPFWGRLVELADATILSSISSGSCDAYLLSESSLFVWDRKILMITCGTTRLPRAAVALLEELDLAAVTGFFYERKNEMFPHMQPTSFLDDAETFARKLPGRAYQFGHKDLHHLNLFSLERDGGAAADDGTIEMLMYGLDEEVRERFSRGRQGAEWLHADSSLAGHVTDAIVDEHQFEPSGYSLNALAGDRYSTLHVSPNTVGSYASFETNLVHPKEMGPLVEDVAKLFRPRAFDLVVFDVESTGVPIMPGYQILAHQACRLRSGYEVHFMSFHRPAPGIHPPDELPLVQGEKVR